MNLVFLKSTGVISNPILIDNFFGANYEDGAYGIEFSPNSNLLYVTELDLVGFQSKLYQFDLSLYTAPAIIASSTIIYDGRDVLAALQLGSNGQIYACNGFSRHLNAILQSLFVARIETEDACMGDAVMFAIETDEPIDSISWDFGDTEVSDVLSPTHNYLAPGEYLVRATIKSGNSIITVNKEVTVFELPIAYQPTNFIICEDQENDGFETFDLLQKNAEVLGDQSELDFEVSYFNSFEDAEAHENILGAQTINKENYQELFVKVSNRLNSTCYSISSFLLIADGGLEPLEPNNFKVTTHRTSIFTRLENRETACFTTSTFDIVINEVAAFKPEDLNLCDDASNDGKAWFDLASQKASILNGGIGQVTFHLSQSDADLGDNGLLENFENQMSMQEIFVRVEHPEDPTCFDTTSFFITLTYQSVININKTWYMCPGEDVTLFLDSVHENYLWSNGALSSEIVVNSPGTYTVTVNDSLDDDSTCAVTETVQVIEAPFPTAINIITEDWTSSSNSIKIEVDGSDNYLFSIDDDVYQSTNSFNDLEAGDYMVYVKNEYDCLVYSEAVYLLNYPKFFTPNNDGFNDYWNIDFLEKEPQTEIHIFDRYGKLIKRLTPLSQGWDGTFNGQLLATSDYWFVLHIPGKDKTYKGHFTLKR